MNWLGFSLLALGLWGVWGFLGKVAAQHLPSPMIYLLAISGHLAVVAYLLGRGIGVVAWEPWGMGAALGSGLAMAVGLLFFYEALGRGPAAAVVVKMVSWRILQTKFNLTNVQFGILWYNDLVAGTFAVRITGA